jgi:hypothetical protein
MITVITHNINNFLDEIDIDEAIEEAIRNNSKIINVIIEAPVWYDDKYDEYYTKEIDRTEIDIEEDLGITLEDLIEYCHYNYKEER